MVNRLSKERSLYLQQHKNNPIDWWPYIPEAFEKAQERNVPIFLSIGYSSCHWCHVMARESFEDPEVAKFMNSNFVNIKVDREERPGIDKIFQDIYQLVHKRGGGWPLSVWMTPEGKPIFLGTYFPNIPKHGLPSFIQVSQKIAQLWKEDRENVLRQAEALGTGIQKLNEYILSGDSGTWQEDKLPILVQKAANNFDWENGGIGFKPKFPHSPLLRFLLYYGKKTRNEKIQEFVRFSYKKMIRGGIFDQLKGGFARYSVDEQWLIPHFEKMLYDNAELLMLGAHLYQIAPDEEIRTAMEKTLFWLYDEMEDEQGGFYASLNAESEHREGKYYVWHLEEITALVDQKKLTPIQATILRSYYGITQEGNFEDPHHPEIKGMNVLSITKSIEELMQETNLPKEKIREEIETARKVLLAEREKRIKPDRDEKIITSWNALLISALLTVAQAFEIQQPADKALKALDRLLSHVIEEDGVLRVVPQDEKARKIYGVLEDYAFLAKACIDAYEHTSEQRYLTEALRITRLADRRFYDFNLKNYKLSDEPLLDNPIDFSDNSLPSAISIMIQVLYKLGRYHMMQDLIERGQIIVDRALAKAEDMFIVLGEFFLAREYYMEQAKEIVQIHDGSLNDKYLRYYLPVRLIYRWVPKANLPKWEVLEGRTNVTKQTIFVCQGQTCSLPITTENELSVYFSAQ